MREKSDIGLAPLCLAGNEVIGKVLRNRGNLFDVLVPQSHWPRALKILNSEKELEDTNQPTELLVGLSPLLRNRYFVRRNGLVVLSLENLGPMSKVNGEITNIVEDQRDWEKSLRHEWPVEFSRAKEESNIELPPSLSDEEEEEYTDEEEQEEEKAE